MLLFNLIPFQDEPPNILVGWNWVSIREGLGRGAPAKADSTKHQTQGHAPSRQWTLFFFHSLLLFLRLIFASGSLPYSSTTIPKPQSMPLRLQGLPRSFAGKSTEKIHHRLKAFFWLVAGNQLGNRNNRSQESRDCTKPSKNISVLNEVNNGIHVNPFVSRMPQSKAPGYRLACKK